jgi:IclR family acetate operon transcriptional repressor
VAQRYAEADDPGAIQDGQAARTGRYWVRAVDRTVQLLEAVAGDGGRDKTLTEVARLADMPEPSALRYLATLAARGLVEHVGSGEQGRYRIGLGLFGLAEHAVGFPDLRAIARPYMHRLLTSYEETVNLALFRHKRLVIIEVLEGLRSIRQGARLGEQDRLRSTALGKAILATHTDEEALCLVRAEPIEQHTSRTITTDEGMLGELQAIRERGYAIDEEESEIGLRCVGVAISGRPGQTFGLSISGPSHLFTQEVVKEAGPVLCEIGRELTTRLTSNRSLQNPS